MRQQKYKGAPLVTLQDLNSGELFKTPTDDTRFWIKTTLKSIEKITTLCVDIETGDTEYFTLSCKIYKIDAEWVTL